MALCKQDMDVLVWVGMGKNGLLDYMHDVNWVVCRFERKDVLVRGDFFY